jgi:paraquat-inducible protein A
VKVPAIALASVPAVACPDCDLLHVPVLLRAGEKAHCTRCAGVLSIAGPCSFETSLATAIAASITFWIANTEPLIRLSALGIAHTATIARSAAALWVEGGLAEQGTAILVAFCAILAPGAWLLLTLAALLATGGRRAPQWASIALRWSGELRDWAMPEVMLLGTLVAYSKVAEMADASPGAGLYAAGALVILMASLRSSLDLPALWSRIALVK